MNVPIVAGVDGGGTRTRVTLATVDGRVLGSGEGGSGNYHDVGLDGFAANVRAAVHQAWSAAAVPPQRVEAVFLGLGSIVTAEDRDAIRGAVEAADWAPRQADRIGVDHDLRIALEGCLGGEPGIVLIAGTGSSAFGRTAAGDCWKSGGWGPLLDDVGSGHWLGRQAMLAAVRASDGRGAETCLSQTVLAALQLTSPLEILKRVELEGMSRREIADLGRLVLAAAREGDAVARQIIETGADALAELVATVAARLSAVDEGFRPVVATTGGLTTAGDVFASPLRVAISRRVPGIEFATSITSPVIGAALLAMAMAVDGALSGDAKTRLFAEGAKPRTVQDTPRALK